MNKTLSLVLLVLAVGWRLSLAETTAASAADTLDQQASVEFKNAMKSIDAVKRLPVTGLSMVKADDKLFLVTDNGHFIVAGNLKLVDMWQGKVLKSIEDSQDVEKVNLRKIGLSPDDIAAFKIGNGTQEVTIFVDPMCQYCHELIGQLEPLGKLYTFRLVLVPVLGKDSANVVKKLLCHNDKTEALTALVTQKYDKLPVPGSGCDLKTLQKAVVATKLLDIQGVPYLFLPSYSTHKGGTKSLKTLLENDWEKMHG